MSDGGGISLPSVPAQTPGLPESYRSIDFEKFTTLNTKPTRPAIAPEEMYWCDGWMPIGPSNLRILWGTGPALNTGHGGLTTIWMGFGNIADQPYCITLASDGGIYATNTYTNVPALVAPPGTIINPSTIFGFSQWGSQYLIFTKDQENGYWLWDGTLLFGAGSVGPVVTIDNAGVDYTIPPTVNFITTGSGTGATFDAQVDNGQVTRITVTNPGSGFTVDDFIALFIVGGGTDPSAVAAPCTIDTTHGGLDTLVILTGGNQYTGRTFAVVNGDGIGGSVSLAITNGVITGAAVVNPGTGYSFATITVVDPGIPGSGGSAIPPGSGGQVEVQIAFGQVVTIPMIDGGAGYVSPPVVTIQGDGTGATGVALLTPSGQVGGVLMTAYGKGYTVALASFSGGNKSASASVQLMPFGISGTAVEVYNSIVWVTNGASISNNPPKNRTIFSSSGSPINFGASGGAFQSNDSFLRVGYHWLRQTNGFLYLGGDSSLNYISGVQTSTPSASGVAAQAVTTFGNVNVDPQLGSPWPSSVQVFSRNIVFANSLGIFVSYGGAVTKASLPLDGFYGSGPIYGPTANFSSAVANIFGIPVYMLLLPVVDRLAGVIMNKLLMWDGRHWFTSQQDRPLVFIATQEINSVLTAWGTDGTEVFPLFAQPSRGFTKRVQSKLFADPVYWANKTAIRLNGIAFSYAIDDPLFIDIDNEKGIGTGHANISVTPAGSGLLWLNNNNEEIAWTSGFGTLAWSSPGLDVFGPYPIGQQGRLLGVTVATTASDIVLLSINIGEQIYTLNA